MGNTFASKTADMTSTTPQNFKTDRTDRTDRIDWNTLSSGVGVEEVLARLRGVDIKAVEARTPNEYCCGSKGCQYGRPDGKPPDWYMGVAEGLPALKWKTDDAVVTAEEFGLVYGGRDFHADLPALRW
jgi:hypothetical protein